MKYFGLDSSQTAVSSQQTTKEANAKLLFRIIEQEGHVSRAQLAKLSTLSPSTVSVLTEELIQNDVILEAGEGESSPTGRKPIILEINPSGLQIPCFSFKPTGLLYVLYDLKYQVLEQHFLPYGTELSKANSGSPDGYITPPEDSILNLFDIILNQRSQMIDWNKVRILTISFNGSFHWETNTFTSSVLGWFLDSQFLDTLRARFNDIPLLVGNNSAFLAYAEKKTCEDKKKNLLYIHIDQGVGAGIILNDQPFSGEFGISGEIGQMYIKCSNDNIPLNKQSRIEASVSLNRIMQTILDGIAQGEETLLMQLCGYDQSKINFTLIGKALSSGDPFITKILHQVATQICIGINNTLCILGSMDVFIGGGIEELGIAFLKMLQTTMAQIGYSRILMRTTIQYSKLPINGDCLGAAKAYVDNMFTVIL